MDNPPGRKKDKAQQSAGGQGPDLSFHPVVLALQRQDGSFPDVVELRGYLGPSDNQGYIRLYFDLTFKSYADIPKDAIIYREPYDPLEEARPSTILVSTKAKLHIVEVHALENVEASFLGGSIAACCPKQITPCCHHPCFLVCRIGHPHSS
jgi:hypothetical protein